MRTLIDTCVLSEIQRPKGDPRVRLCFESLPEDDVYLSVLTLGELRKGIDKLRASRKKKSLSDWFDRVLVSAQGRVVPIDAETALLWGEINARAEKRGRTIPAIDGLLAATALRHGMRLMTRNVSDFEPTGVQLINPWEGAVH